MVVLAALALLLTRNDPGERPSGAAEGIRTQELSAAYSALCMSRARVDSDLAGARDVFFSRAHATLHIMAAEIAKTDRSLAAELLEAKNRVEQELGGVVPETAAGALDGLLSVSKQALISLGVRSPSCPT